MQRLKFFFLKNLIFHFIFDKKILHFRLASKVLTSKQLFVIKLKKLFQRERDDERCFGGPGGPHYKQPKSVSDLSSVSLWPTGPSGSSPTTTGSWSTFRRRETTSLEARRRRRRSRCTPTSTTMRWSRSLKQPEVPFEPERAFWVTSCFW